MTKLQFTDTYRHKGLRNSLVATIRSNGISDEAVLEAINNVPRHFFFDTGLLQFAYIDKAFSIGAGQTISQPSTVAYQTELLKVKPFDKILEIGTGSGYQASILYYLKASVYSIERQYELYSKTKELLQKLKYNIKTFFGDGYLGLPTFAPFDKIIITAAAPSIPEKLLAQLKIGGIMVVPINKNAAQVMTVITKINDDKHEIQEFGTFKFVPMLSEKVNNGNDKNFNTVH